MGDIRKKRKRYEEIRIQDIITLDAQEPKYQSEKSQKEKLLLALQEQYRDVTEKYQRLYVTIDEEWKAFELAQKEELQRQRDAVQTERDKGAIARDKRKKAVEDAYNEWLAASDERMAVLQEECNRTDKRLSELQYWHPMQKDIDACKEDISKLYVQEKDLNSQLVVARNDLKALRGEGEMKQEQTKIEFARKQEALQTELSQLQEELSKTEETLARWKGSLYEWLTQNKAGWEDNIGKVVDEQQVLYAQGLDPELSADGNLFGISLNLNAIPVHHRTPDEYRSLQKQQQEAIAVKKKEWSDLQQQCEKELESISKSYKGKLSELQQQETNLRVRVEQIPLKIKDAETQLHQLERKTLKCY